MRTNLFFLKKKKKEICFNNLTSLLPCIFWCTVCPHLWCCCIWHFNWFTNESRPPPTPKPRHACMLGNYWTIILIALFLIVVRWWTQHTPVCTLRRMQIHIQDCTKSYLFSFSLLLWRDIILSAHLFYSLHSLTWRYISILSYSYALLFWW